MNATCSSVSGDGRIRVGLWRLLNVYPTPKLNGSGLAPRCIRFQQLKVSGSKGYVFVYVTGRCSSCVNTLTKKICIPVTALIGWDLFPCVCYSVRNA